MEYTVIGDCVNVASRLTSSDISKAGEVAVSEETKNALGAGVEAAFIGEVLVKGRAGAVKAWRIDKLGPRP